MPAFVVLIKQIRNALNCKELTIKKNASLKIKQMQSLMATIIPGSRGVNCLVTSRNETSEADETSLNKQPTYSSSRRVNHRQASENAYCCLPSVCSDKWNKWCADMRSINRRPECYLAFIVLLSYT